MTLTRSPNLPVPASLPRRASCASGVWVSVGAVHWRAGALRGPGRGGVSADGLPPAPGNRAGVLQLFQLHTAVTA